MTTFNTYDEILAASDMQVSAQQLINGRMHTKAEGWTNIEISSELREKIADELSELYGGRSKTKSRVYSSLRYGTPQHWGLGRTFLENYGNNPRFSYCAGQDYPYELNQIRTALK